MCPCDSTLLLTKTERDMVVECVRLSMTSWEKIQLLSLPQCGHCFCTEFVLGGLWFNAIFSLS